MQNMKDHFCSWLGREWTNKRFRIAVIFTVRYFSRNHRENIYFSVRFRSVDQRSHKKALFFTLSLLAISKNPQNFSSSPFRSGLGSHSLSLQPRRRTLTVKKPLVSRCSRITTFKPLTKPHESSKPFNSRKLFSNLLEGLIVKQKTVSLEPPPSPAMYTAIRRHLWHFSHHGLAKLPNNKTHTSNIRITSQSSVMSPLSPQYLQPSPRENRSLMHRIWKFLGR